MFNYSTDTVVDKRVEYFCVMTIRQLFFSAG